MNTTQSEYGKTQNKNNHLDRANKTSMMQQIEAALNAGGKTAHIKSSVYEIAVTRQMWQTDDMVTLLWRITGNETYTRNYYSTKDAIYEINETFPASVRAKLAIYENGVDTVAQEIYN